MLKRVLLILALSSVLWVIWNVAEVAYYIHTNPGPVNSFGGQPPTACRVLTVEHDCEKLSCISHAWYCNNHGVPKCYEGKCMCFYGCL
jgi:hypothetical protein